MSLNGIWKRIYWLCKLILPEKGEEDVRRGGNVERKRKKCPAGRRARECRDFQWTVKRRRGEREEGWIDTKWEDCGLYRKLVCPIWVHGRCRNEAQEDRNISLSVCVSVCVWSEGGRVGGNGVWKGGTVSKYNGPARRIYRVMKRSLEGTRTEWERVYWTVDEGGCWTASSSPYPPPLPEEVVYSQLQTYGPSRRKIPVIRTGVVGGGVGV